MYNVQCNKCNGKGTVYAHIMHVSGNLRRGILCKGCYNSVGGTILTYELTQDNIMRVEKIFLNKGKKEGV